MTDQSEEVECVCGHVRAAHLDGCECQEEGCSCNRFETEADIDAKPTKLHFEIFVAMNEAGDVGLGLSASEAREMLLDSYESEVVRIVAIGAAMTPPEVETGPDVDIPDTAGETVEVEPVLENSIDVDAGQVARIRDVLPE